MARRIFGLRNMNGQRATLDSWVSRAEPECLSCCWEMEASPQPRVSESSRARCLTGPASRILHAMHWDTCERFEMQQGSCAEAALQPRSTERGSSRLGNNSAMKVCRILKILNMLDGRKSRAQKLACNTLERECQSVRGTALFISAMLLSFE